MKKALFALGMMISVSSFGQTAQNTVNDLSADWDIKRQVNTADYGDSGSFKYLTDADQNLCPPDGSRYMFVAQNTSGDKIRVWDNSPENVEYQSVGSYPEISDVANGFYSLDDLQVSPGDDVSALCATAMSTGIGAVPSTVENLNVTSREDGNGYTLSIFRDIPSAMNVRVSAYNGKTRELLSIASANGEFSHTVAYPGYTGGSTMYGHVRIENEPTGAGDFVIFYATTSVNNLDFRTASTNAVEGIGDLVWSNDKLTFSYASDSDIPPTLFIVGYDQDQRVFDRDNQNISYGADLGEHPHTIHSTSTPNVYEARFSTLEDYQYVKASYSALNNGLFRAIPNSEWLNGIEVSTDYYSFFSHPDGVRFRQDVILKYPKGSVDSDITDLTLTGFVEHAPTAAPRYHFDVPSIIHELEKSVDSDGRVTISGRMGTDTFNSRYEDDNLQWKLKYKFKGRWYEVRYEIQLDGGRDNPLQGHYFTGVSSLSGREIQLNTPGEDRGTIGADVQWSFHNVRN